MDVNLSSFTILGHTDSSVYQLCRVTTVKQTVVIL